jgi:hypothetical protein
MQSLSDVISTYIHAKDGNRPWLMQRAFAQDAVLEMDVKTDAISFPALTTGMTDITETLVRGFGQDYENVYTFCMGSPPARNMNEFSCDWLVAMSSKESGELRVGCGRYDWFFRALDTSDECLIEKLKIIIEKMQVLPPEHLAAIMSWMSELPYPWCPVEVATRTMPKLQGFAEIADYINCRMERRPQPSRADA